MLLKQFRVKGFRITRARRSIISIFLKTDVPLSAQEVMAHLKREGIYVNRTTVYRDIGFLVSQDMLRELHFGDGRKRYEEVRDDHHHHLLCVNCRGVECVRMERCLEAEQKKILEERNFRTIGHSLKFLGLCMRCQ